MKFTFAAIAALMLFAPVAKADIINCSFTEPFITTTYSMTNSTLTIKAMDEKTEVIKNVSFQIKAAGDFVLMSKDKKVLQTLKLNNNGSDGMSDRVFPIEGVMGKTAKANGLVGGCETNSLKAREQKNDQVIPYAGTAPLSYGSNNGMCSEDTVRTQYGCLSVGPCTAGYGYHPTALNGKPGCVQATDGTNINNGVYGF